MMLSATRPFVARAGTAAAMAGRSVRTKHTLPQLPYEYSALEPAISAEIMELHHSKHHQTYVNGLNTAEEQMKAALEAKDAKKAIELQAALKFNGGGHINHTLFWENLAPTSNGGGKLNDGKLDEIVSRDFGSLDELKKRMNAAAAGIQGSGWAWLVSPIEEQVAFVP
jgi:Fe-Mn family superoxide dismutase